jgi:hypothetical protein
MVDDDRNAPHAGAGQRQCAAHAAEHQQVRFEGME